MRLDGGGIFLVVYVINRAHLSTLDLAWSGLWDAAVFGKQKGFPEEGMGANRDCESSCSALRWTVTHVR